MSTNILSLPNEILIEIFKTVNEDRNLSLVCKRFYEIITAINEYNLSLNLKSMHVFNPNFNFNDVINRSSRINLTGCADNEQFMIFLRKYGEKVVSLKVQSGLFDITKYLHLMPKLETLSSEVTEHTLPIISERNLEKHSIVLKKIEIWVDRCSAFWTQFEVFDCKELVISNIYAWRNITWLSFVKESKNLKKISIESIYDIPEVLVVLAKKNLESLSLNLQITYPEENVKEFFRTQKSLKHLELNFFSYEVLSLICETCTDLESLVLCRGNFANEILGLNMSKLVKLKTLKVNSSPLNMIQFNEILSLQSSVLHTLEIEVSFEVTCEIAENIVSHFPQLKSLNISTESYDTSFSAIFKIFNRVESLKIYPINSSSNSNAISDTFYLENHKNLNLRTLDLHVNSFDKEKLHEKVFRDFPNLEEFPVDFYRNLLNDHPLMKNIPESYVNINAIENLEVEIGNDSLHFNLSARAYIVKDGKREISINFWMYCGNEQLQATITSPRKLKTIHIDYYDSNNMAEVENLMKLCQLIGEHVTSLSISYGMPLKLMKKIIEGFPNLQNLFMSSLATSGQKYKNEEVTIIEKKIKCLSMYYCLGSEDNLFRDAYEPSEDFCNHVRFPDNSLECFEFITYIEYHYGKNFLDFDCFTKFIENQKLLTKVEKGYKSDDDDDFCSSHYHYTVKSETWKDELKIKLND